MAGVKMKCGEGKTLHCGNCELTFAVVLEPDAAKLLPKDRPQGIWEVDCCPFCAEEYPEDVAEREGEPEFRLPRDHNAVEEYRDRQDIRKENERGS